MSPEKQCRRCKEHKALDDFPAAVRMRDGLSSWCRWCHAERTNQWRAAKRAQSERVAREAYLALREASRKQEEAWRRRAAKSLEREHGPSTNRRVKPWWSDG